MHIVVRAKEESVGLSSIIRDFKRHTAKELIKWITTDKRESRRGWLEVVMKYHAKYGSWNQTYQLWQQNNHPKLCAHPKFTLGKITYIHNNPVVAGIVNNPEDYVYSSALVYSEEKGTGGLVKVRIIDFGSQAGYVFG